VFTGIIRNAAAILSVADHPAGRRLALPTFASDHALGESIAVNGVCLTVAQLNPDSLTFDIIPETLAKTNLGDLKPNDRVHVERALRAGDPIDGHFVQGHVDGVGTLIEEIATDQESRLRIQAPPRLARYLIPKGSIAIDGVSLTLARVDKNQFEVALIPTTRALTSLTGRKPGSRFNLECDMIAKTIISHLERIRPAADDREAKNEHEEQRRVKHDE
jgi:riboflavin synthase